jgi:hypothetical protein
MMRSKKKNKIALRFFGYLISVLTATSMLGCIAAIPIAVKYLKSSKHITATLQINEKADTIYQIIVRELQVTPNVLIKERDDAKFQVEATRGEQYGSFKVTSIGANKSHVIITVDAGEKEEDEQLAKNIVNRICEEVKAPCKTIEE